jgi:hypothetical protein
MLGEPERMGMTSADPPKPPKLVELLNEANKNKSTLVRLLQEAARLEHCLLNTYLFAACSLKTLPEEFATLRDGSPNRRRAIQFERVRDWKLSILSITHEEMMHLHYVQCLLRALGEPADFTLPDRSPQSDDWRFEGWRAHAGTEEPEHGTEVPVEALTPETIKRFILYEATDALQDADPFGDEMTHLFEKLHDFEVEYRLEEALVNVSDEHHSQLRDTLLKILRELPPCEKRLPPEGFVAHIAGPTEADFDRVRFQSIADLYNNQILPRYRDAFVLGQVVNDNRDLNNELANTGERMLPIGPIQRDKNFERQEQLNIHDPLANYATVDNIIGQIVDEGEGMKDFIGGATAILDEVKKQGVRALLDAVRKDQGFTGGIEGDGVTPDWLARIMRVRNSHLYRFAMIRAQFDTEQRLAEQCGASFNPARSPLFGGTDTVDKFTAEATAHFNACYLVLRAWLSRYYDPRQVQSDQRRRLGIEVLAGWPMMSVAIRPFLELLALLPVRGSALFRSDDQTLAAGPPGAAELNDMFRGAHNFGDGTVEVMDAYALQILDATAKWARQARDTVAELTTDPTAQAVIGRRLQALSILDEFQRQIVYREHGGYSDTQADAGYPHREPDRYEEFPLGGTANSPPLFAESLVLRLRFSGRCLVQLATDPEPPTDEAGCSGTMMLTAADAPAHLDRALVMQPAKADNNIIREPQDRLPPLGVQVREVALMVTDYPSGTTRTVPVPGPNPAEEPRRFTIEGLNPILVCDPKDLLGEHHRLGIDLLEKDGTRPYLNGENHLVWEDGEPIDPFILAVILATDGKKSPVELFCREIYNEGRTLMQMDPQQRARSLRGPVAFDQFTNAPAWVHATLSAPELIGINSTSGYLDDRAAALAGAISDALEPNQRSRTEIDCAVSMLERRRRVVNPKRTTLDWLPLLLHYGHTVSGALRQVESANNILITKLQERCGLSLNGAENTHDRNESNGRWMMTYGLGYMDTDQLSDLTCGELLIPLPSAAPADKPLTIVRTWPVAAAAADVNAYACRFDRPFAQPSYGPPGPPYTVVDKIRELRHPGYPPLRETLQRDQPDSYTYSIAGLPGLNDCTATFATSTRGDQNSMLKWTVQFTCKSPLKPITAIALFAGYGAALETSLYQRFPRLPNPVAG